MMRCHLNLSQSQGVLKAAPQLCSLYVAEICHCRLYRALSWDKHKYQSSPVEGSVCQCWNFGPGTCVCTRRLHPWGIAGGCQCPEQGWNILVSSAIAVSFLLVQQHLVWTARLQVYPSCTAAAVKCGHTQTLL